MYKLIGFRYVDMRDGGKEIKGYSCFFSVDEQDDELVGRSAIKVFFSEDKFPEFQPQLDDEYLLIFNQKGKLVGYNKIDSNGVLEDE